MRVPIICKALLKGVMVVTVFYFCVAVSILVLKFQCAYSDRHVPCDNDKMCVVEPSLVCDTLNGALMVYCARTSMIATARPIHHNWASTPYPVDEQLFEKKATERHKPHWTAYGEQAHYYFAEDGDQPQHNVKILLPLTSVIIYTLESGSAAFQHVFAKLYREYRELLCAPHGD